MDSDKEPVEAAKEEKIPVVGGQDDSAHEERMEEKPEVKTLAKKSVSDEDDMDGEETPAVPVNALHKEEVEEEEKEEQPDVPQKKPV
jgi:hypothetical protein